MIGKTRRGQTYKINFTAGQAGSLSLPFKADWLKSRLHGLAYLAPTVMSFSTPTSGPGVQADPPTGSRRDIVSCEGELNTGQNRGPTIHIYFKDVD